MEILVATMILAITFGGLLAGFVSVRKYISRANDRLVAANLIRSQLSMIGRDIGGAVSGNVLPDQTIDGKIYTMTQTVTDVGAYPAVGTYRQVDVTISYPSD